MELREQIRDAVKQAGVTAVWVTHDQEEAMTVGDRIAVMREGHLEQTDTPERCYEAPASRFVAGFFGEGRFIAAQPKGDLASTVLGECRVIHNRAAGQKMDAGESFDILLRPHDVDMISEDPGNATIISHRFEGETRRYGLRLDGGERIDARLNHEQRFKTGARIRARIAARHPLVAFPLRLRS